MTKKVDKMQNGEENGSMLEKAYTKVLRLEWRVCPQKCEAQCVCGGRKDTEGVNDMHSKAGGG